MGANNDWLDNISPIDSRYWDQGLADYLSERAAIKYRLLLELALVWGLYWHRVLSESVAKEIVEACLKVTPEEVVAEEKRIKHDIKALVNCICDKISDKAKPFVHLTATSNDIIDSANILRYRDAIKFILLSDLLKLESVLIDLTLQEAETVQIGRTHGQHAVPITLGFAFAEYVSRLGDCIESIKEASGKLQGKFSGAVGAYNAASLLVKDPEKLESQILGQYGLEPAEYSTQILMPERLDRLIYEIVLTAGVMANLVDDIRHLQRTEIGEVNEMFGDDQVGSSTMPQKRNPIYCENIKSCWKITMPKIVTVLINQLSEHQRDLTGSAAMRTYGEIIAYVAVMAKRLKKVAENLQINYEALKHNLALQNDLIIAEPLYIILSSLGYPNAHEKVRLLTLQAQKDAKPLRRIIRDDPEISPYLDKMTTIELAVLSHPHEYTGLASQKARKIANKWKKRLGL